MESYSQNSNKLDFQHEARILNGIWLITALGMVATAGLALVIIMNAALMSERPVWVISCLMIVLWSGIISHGRNKLLELTGKCHSEELWSPVRCAFTGALTLYYYFIGFFGILAAIAITLVWQRHTRFFH
ncbi:TPA: hypothetical protein SIK05_002561 [Escherichia coli]|nr:hypothetical protein [Escherichia coli]